MCLIAILILPAFATAGQISGDKIKLKCENYKPGSEGWKTGCGLFGEAPLPHDTACDCYTTCDEAFAICKVKCLTHNGGPLSPEVADCAKACSYAVSLCKRECKQPCNPNTQ